jgi:putative endonuclease
MTWYVYILRCADNTLYTGVTTDIARRMREHNGEVRRGARYTLAKRPVALVYAETTDSRSNALKREATIKKLSKRQKENLTRSPRYVSIESC